MGRALCLCVPGLLPERAWLYRCHRLVIWTKAFGMLRNGFGVSNTPVGPRAVSGQEVRAVALAQRSQTAALGDFM